MASSDVGTIRLGLEANATSFQRDIQNILNSTEGSVRSRAARLGAIYRRQGMTQSSAMRRAWADVRRNVSTSCNSMTRSTETATNRISSAFSGLGSKIAAAFSLAVIAAFTKKCIEAAASVNALNSQFEQTFGSMQAQAEQALQTVAKNSGIVQSRLQSVGTSIYAFAKTAGMDSVTALNMMQEALQITADSAAYYDRSLEDTAESLKSFLKGNFENDAALGLSCTETTRNTVANKLYGKSFVELSESQKQLALLQMVKEANQLSGAMGQASREADGWENVTGNLKEAWKQLLAVIGQPALKVATQAIKSLTDKIQMLTEYAKQAGNAIREVFGWKKDEASKSMSSVANSADSATESIEATTKANEKLKNSLAGFDKLNVLKKEDEDESGTDSVTTPVQSANVSQANNELTATEKSLDRITNKLKEIGSKLGFNDVNWSAIKGNIDSIFEDLEPIAKSSFNGAEKVAKSYACTVGKVVGGVVGVTGKSLETVTGGVSKWLDENKEKISSGITEISDNTSEGIDNIGNFYDSVFNTLGGSIDRMRPKAETAISSLLTGFSDLGLSLGAIWTEAFSIATGEIEEWATNNQETIGLFFDNIQQKFIDVSSLLGNIMSDLATDLTTWWEESGGKQVFENVSQMFTNIGTTFMEVYNKWISPIWNTLIATLQSAWDNWLRPTFSSVLDFFTKVANCISTLWNTWISPLLSFLIDCFAPIITNIFTRIKDVFSTVFSYIGGAIKAIMRTLGGLIDFITGVFTGNWELAWQGIKNYIGGIFDGIWNVVKTAINLIIDAINALWSGFYTAITSIINGVGDIAQTIGEALGQDDWGWEVPSEPPLIPKLAKGGIVKAPTLALVGDNAGANNGNPEVVAPLNKLKGMFNEGDGSAEDTVILSQILQYLIKIYEAVSSEGNTNIIEFIAKLDESVVFKRMIELNKQYKKRHNGKSAFA